MNIAILGAAGQTGKQLIEKALVAGHTVTGLARSPEKILFDDPRVIKRAADGFDEASVIAGLEGADAVITTVGKTNLRDKRVNLSTAAHAGVIAGMRKHNIKRLLAISSTGAARIKRDGIRRNIYLFLRRKYYRDMYDMEVQVLGSGLDATVLRAPFLINGPAQRQYNVIKDETYPNGSRVSRADLAQFALDAVEQGTYINEVVAIADPL